MMNNYEFTVPITAYNDPSEETFDIDFMSPDPWEPEIPVDEGVDVTFRTQTGRVGVASIDDSAQDLYVEEFLRVMGAMYRKLTFVNDLKIEIDYGGRTRTYLMAGDTGEDFDG